MANYALTLEEELEKRKVVGTYIWKPNRLFARRGNRYESADTVSDGSAMEVAEMVTEAGQQKLNEINAVAAAEKALLAENEKDYAAVRASLLQTYTRLSNYFAYQGLTEMKSVVDTAIRQL